MLPVLRATVQQAVAATPAVELLIFCAVVNAKRSSVKGEGIHSPVTCALLPSSTHTTDAGPCVIKKKLTLGCLQGHRAKLQNTEKVPLSVLINKQRDEDTEALSSVLPGGEE